MPIFLLLSAIAALGAGFLLSRRASMNADDSGEIPADESPLVVPSWRNLLSRDNNVDAFLAVIRSVEPSPPGSYTSIAGGDSFTDFSEHPFVIDRNRVKPIGTTASGAYQMVRKTWMFPRDALGLPDFSPESQDKAARWLLEFKTPGTDVIEPGGTGNIEIIRSGDFQGALEAYRLEWEALDKILKGRYHTTIAKAQETFENNGGTLA